MLAAYLLYSRDITAEQAISHVRRERPYSIETYEQEDILWVFAEYLEREKAGHEHKQSATNCSNGISSSEHCDMNGASTSKD